MRACCECVAHARATIDAPLLGWLPARSRGWFRTQYETDKGSSADPYTLPPFNLHSGQIKDFGIRIGKAQTTYINIEIQTFQNTCHTNIGTYGNCNENAAGICSAVSCRHGRFVALRLSHLLVFNIPSYQ